METGRNPELLKRLRGDQKSRPSFNQLSQLPPLTSLDEVQSIDFNLPSNLLRTEPSIDESYATSPSVHQPLQCSHTLAGPGYLCPGPPHLRSDGFSILPLKNVGEVPVNTISLSCRNRCY